MAKGAAKETRQRTEIVQLKQAVLAVLPLLGLYLPCTKQLGVGDCEGWSAWAEKRGNLAARGTKIRTAGHLKQDTLEVPPVLGL